MSKRPTQSLIVVPLVHQIKFLGPFYTSPVRSIPFVAVF